MKTPQINQPQTKLPYLYIVYSIYYLLATNNTTKGSPRVLHGKTQGLIISDILLLL